jgi:hypothetical protein
MADNDQSKIRYDEFVSKVQADPANPQATIMLSGYAGHGPEGHVRIYPDPTLGNWYDVPEADIVHSMPIADSKLGGSYVWIKSSAAIKPGSAAAAAPPGPAPAAAPQPVHPTPTAVTLCADCGGQTPATLCQPTAQTHCFICPPLTQNCTHPPQCPPLTQHCTVPPQCPVQSQHCPTQPQFGCPPPSLHCPSSPIVCDTMPPTHIGCPPPSLHCPSSPIVCDTRPPTVACPQTLHCPSSPIVCDTRPPTFVACPQTLHCPSSPIVCDTRPSIAVICTQPPACLQHTLPVVCQPQLTLPGACNVTFTTPQLTTPQFGQAGAQQAQPQAFAAPAPAPAAAPQAAAAGPQPFSLHQICPTPSAVQQCGQPQPSQAFICTQAFICLTPTPQLTQQVFCQQTFNAACLQTANIACLQTANTPCFPVTLAGCTPQSIACQFTPVQNGVFTPFGR